MSDPLVYIQLSEINRRDHCSGVGGILGAGGSPRVGAVERGSLGSSPNIGRGYDLVRDVGMRGVIASPWGGGGA
jgi:hypothetical protein